MNALVTGLCDIERELAHEKGEFALFACFQSPHIQSQWDVVVSAAWAPRHDRTTLQLFISALDRALDPADRLSISRLVVVEPSDEELQRINEQYRGDPGFWEIHGEEHFGYLVEEGFIIASHDYSHFVQELFPPH